MSESQDRPVRHTGGCQCGAVRYAFSAPMTRVGVCFCRMCQKAGGGPFMVFGSVKTADLSWTRGRPDYFNSSSLATRGFCPQCGTPLTYADGGDSVAVTLGSLDDPAAVTPDHVVGREARLPWIGHIDALPAQTTEQAMADQLTGIVNHQHPDHDT